VTLAKVQRMTTNYFPLILQSMLQGIALGVHALWQASLANPWMFVVFAAVIVLAVIGRPARRRRRRY
jgi:membrane protein implicated in regulation of membrane protease activity